MRVPDTNDVRGVVDRSSFPLANVWASADVDVARSWAASGAQWLTARGVDAPARLVRDVAGIVRMLDDAGAGLRDVAPAAGIGLLAERAATLGFGPSGAASCGGASRLLRAADGWLAVTLARDDDVAMIPAWLGLDRPVAGPHWDAVVQGVRGRRVGELVETAALLGLAASGVGEAPPSDVALRSRLVASAPPTAVADLTVVDLGSLWAAPLCADVLARLGARVITVESSQRPDGARRTGRFFESLHRGMESVVLALHTSAGRAQLARLLRRVDVVLEGSRPRALVQMGIDADEMLVSGAARLWVSITGHGRSGDAAQRIGFGDDAAAAGGLVGRVGGRTMFLADAIADPLAGLVAAASVVRLVGSGGRHLVDVAMSGVAASMATRPGDDAVPALADPARPLPRPPERSPRRTMSAATAGTDTDRIVAEFDLDAD